MGVLMVTKKPILPGEILKLKYIEPQGWTQKEVADLLGCDIKVINRIVNGRQAISPTMSIKLSRLTKTDPEFWLSAQNKIDIYLAERRLKKTRKI
jgi:addiction module HigA family antidote